MIRLAGAASLLIVLLVIVAGPASGHNSGCHSAHSCPSDHHTYVWFDSLGRGNDCAQSGADEISAADTVLVVYDGRTYYCHYVGAYALPTVTASPSPTPVQPVATASPTPAAGSCQKPAGVQPISFSKTKYTHIYAHYRRAVRRGWPKTLELNRKGADARRDKLLSGYPTKKGKDRDEYPPAVGRGRGPGLTRGSRPRGWKADVAYVPSSENRSHGATLGIKLRRFCDGTKFRYVFY